VDYFLAIAPGREDDLGRWLGWYEGRLPEGTIPIAYDPFGNLILLGIRGESKGKVLFWDHESELDEEGAAIVTLAPTFEGFLGSFVE
jgi:hypothetical protein